MADLKGRLAGHVALVTGASQGIGRACAVELAKRGAAVALCARNEEKLTAVRDEIVAAGGQAVVFKLDVTNDDEIKSVVKSAIEQLGKVDILVNNAGITKDNLLLRMKRPDWDAVLNTNLTSAYVSIQSVLSNMMKQRWGRIVNIASINGQMGQTGQANYSASKAGLIGLTMSVAREVASRNITVNAVSPGYIETAMTNELSPEMREQMLKFVPLGRVGQDIDVANAVCFLASDDASYITGHVLNVNGGLLMG
jgi:3-oxoacyl-[acyl-carrier protein] reductase